MKKILAILLLISTGLNAQDFYMQTDKQLHIGATYIISSTTATYVFHKTKNKKKAMWIGFGAGMTVGIAKEIYDVKHGNSEFGDLLADIVGSSMGCFIITIPLP
jgi:uncharacterized protein YfiM (DUF2279 family)